MKAAFSLPNNCANLELSSFLHNVYAQIGIALHQQVNLLGSGSHTLICTNDDLFDGLADFFHGVSFLICKKGRLKTNFADDLRRLLQGFHLLPDLLPVVSLIKASLKTVGCDKYHAADFYPPATAY